MFVLLLCIVRVLDLALEQRYLVHGSSCTEWHLINCIMKVRRNPVVTLVIAYYVRAHIYPVKNDTAHWNNVDLGLVVSDNKVLWPALKRWHFKYCVRHC